MEHQPGAGGQPDTSRCFGKYRAQSPIYALNVCVRCPRIKSCVRTAWGLEEPRRTKGRGLYWEGRKRPGPPPPVHDENSGAHLAT